MKRMKVHLHPGLSRESGREYGQMEFLICDPEEFVHSIERSADMLHPKVKKEKFEEQMWRRVCGGTELD